MNNIFKKKIKFLRLDWQNLTILGLLAIIILLNFLLPRNSQKSSDDEGSILGYLKTSYANPDCQWLQGESWEVDIWDSEGHRVHSHEFNLPTDPAVNDVEKAKLKFYWQWSGNYNQGQNNENHEVETPFGTAQCSDLGCDQDEDPECHPTDEELEGQWLACSPGPEKLTGNWVKSKGNLPVTASFNGDNSSKGSHKSRVTISWCVTSQPTETPTGTPTETPTETPTGTPTETPTETPTQTPTGTPSETPTETPTGTLTPTPTATPTPEDEEPMCKSLNVSPSSGDKDLLVTAIVAGEDPGGSIVEYRINWGDGSDNVYQTSDTFTHTYTKEGEFTVKGWVQDSDGHWAGGGGDCEKRVDVDEEEEDKEKPRCDDLLASVTSGELPLTVKFDIEAHDPDGSLNQYWFDFGDGIIDEQDGPHAEHIYDRAGEFMARARVRDHDNQWSDFTSACEVRIEAKSKPAVLGATAPPAAPKAGWSALGVGFLGLLGLLLILI